MQQGLSWFFLVCAFCYVILFGMEYSKYVRGQNWVTADAVVENAVNSLPITRFNQSRINSFAVLINWSYIKYNYAVGDGHYDKVEEMGPHLTVFDWLIGPMAVRFKPGDTIQIKYNPHDPNESTHGFEIFKPFETLLGSAMFFLVVGLVTMYFDRIMMSTEADEPSMIEELKKLS